MLKNTFHPKCLHVSVSVSPNIHHLYFVLFLPSWLPVVVSSVMACSHKAAYCGGLVSQR